MRPSPSLPGRQPTSYSSACHGPLSRQNRCWSHSQLNLFHFLLVANIHHMAMVRPGVDRRAPRSSRAVQVRVHPGSSRNLNTYMNHGASFLVGMLLWNYWLCVLIDPGRVPEGWQPDVRSEQGYEVKPLTGAPRFCRTCAKYKPPRAHHCKQCNRYDLCRPC